MSIHPHCREAGHNWGNWYVAVGDTYEPSKGERIYRRECTVMGCTFIQKCDTLAPVDTPIEEELP
jgi:hypothetical protein